MRQEIAFIEIHQWPKAEVSPDSKRHFYSVQVNKVMESQDITVKINGNVWHQNEIFK